MLKSPIIIKTNQHMKMKHAIPLGPASVSPGEVLLEEFILPLGLTQAGLAAKMGIGRMRINDIIRGQRAITAETAILLGEALGTSARFWMNLQASYDLARTVIKRRNATRLKAAA
jgi:addiction module HigA family antidote